MNNIGWLGVLDWIKKQAVPQGKKVDYPYYTVDDRPEKDEIYCTRITCGGDVLYLFGDITTQIASRETIKVHWNLMISTLGANYCIGNIANIYLIFLLPKDESVRFQHNLIPPHINKYYKLDELGFDRFVYAHINRA